MKVFQETITIIWPFDLILLQIYYNQRARLRIISIDYYSVLEDIIIAVDTINTSNSII